jgi:hypothetical protein
MGLLDKLKKSVGGVDKDLLANGQLGRGIILALDIKGTTLQSGNGLVERVCEMTLEVALDNVPRYQAKTRQRVPEIALGTIQPGHTTVPVRVDPNDPQNIAIDWDEQLPEVEVAVEAGAVTAADILAKGVPVDGVIVQSQPLGMKREGVDVYGFLLTLLPEGAPPEQIKVGFAVPDAAKPLLYPGSKVRCKWLADNHEDVVVDWTATLDAAT